MAPNCWLPIFPPRTGGGSAPPIGPALRSLATIADVPVGVAPGDIGLLHEAAYEWYVFAAGDTPDGVSRGFWLPQEVAATASEVVFYAQGTESAATLAAQGGNVTETGNGVYSSVGGFCDLTSAPGVTGQVWISPSISPSLTTATRLYYRSMARSTSEGINRLFRLNLTASFRKELGQNGGVPLSGLGWLASNNTRSVGAYDTLPYALLPTPAQDPVLIELLHAGKDIKTNWSRDGGIKSQLRSIEAGIVSSFDIMAGYMVAGTPLTTLQLKDLVVVRW